MRASAAGSGEDGGCVGEGGGGGGGGEEGGRGGGVVDVDGVSSTGLSDGEGDGFGYSET